MEAPYDLFEMRREGFPIWLGAVSSLEQARNRLRELAQTGLGLKYFARDFYSGSIVAISNHTAQPAAHQAS
jgi:hypothetical protein